jgi:hypothetical protein
MGLVFVEEAFPASINTDELALEKIKHKNTRKFSSSLLHQFVYKK